jgi:hypothetical protein
MDQSEINVAIDGKPLFNWTGDTAAVANILKGILGDRSERRHVRQRARSNLCGARRHHRG